jgi:hypothetical protein
MRIVGPATEEEVVYSFAEAETPNPDRATAIGAIIARRGPFLTDLLNRGTGWFHAEIAVDRLGVLRVAGGHWWGELVPPHDLDSFTSALEAGKNAPDPRFAPVWRAIRDKYEPRLDRGRPILVAVNSEGPFTILDGTHRLAAHLSRSRAGLAVPDPIRVFLGTGPPVDKWRFLVR